LKVGAYLLGTDFEQAFTQSIIVSQRGLEGSFWNSRERRFLGSTDTRVAAARTAGQQSLLSEEISSIETGEDDLAAFLIMRVDLDGAGEHDEHGVAGIAFANDVYAATKGDVFRGVGQGVEPPLVETSKQTAAAQSQLQIGDHSHKLEAVLYNKQGVG